MTVLHCAVVSMVAGKGYTSFLIITFFKLKFPSRCLSHKFFILCCLSFAVSTKYASLVSMLPSGANLMLSVWHASDSSRHCIVVCWCELSSMVMFPGDWLHFLYLHLLLTYSKSTKYQKHISGTSAPPVAHSKPSQWLTTLHLLNHLFCSVWVMCYT